MAKLLNLLARLYPKAWRERYGVEFEALLEDIRPEWMDLFDVLKGGLTVWVMRLNPATVAIFALVGGIAALSAAFAKPNQWRSEGIIHVQSFDNRPIRDVVAEMSQRAFTNASLANVITQADLYPAERARLPMENVIETAKKSIQIRPIKANPNAFQVAFVYPDAQVAQRVANRLLNTFVEENLRFGQNFFKRNGFHPAPVRVSVNAPATLPNSPIRPNLPAWAISGMGAGSALGILFAWIARRRRNAIVG